MKGVIFLVGCVLDSVLCFRLEVCFDEVLIVTVCAVYEWRWVVVNMWCLLLVL